MTADAPRVLLHDRLDAVGAAAWDSLLDRARLRSPFLSWVWQREWVRAFAAGRRLEIRKVEDADGTLLAVLPLYEAAPAVLELVGGADVSDYLDCIACEGREADAWTALLQSRASETVAWELHAVPGASPTVTALPKLAEACGLTATVTVEERCPVLALPPSWDEYLAGLPGRHRHELLRKQRRLEREAPDARVSSALRPAEIETRFGDFLDLHRRSTVGKARFMDAHMEGFFRRVVVTLAERGGARLTFLDTAGGPIAAFVTLEWNGTVALYNSGFRPDRSALSPGVVLLMHVIRSAIERGKRRFDFLRGEERYKYDFGPVSEDVCRVTVSPAAP